MSEIFNMLTAEESKFLRDTTGDKFDDPMTAMKVVLAIRQVAGGKELMLDTGEMLSGNSLTELAEENKEVAKLLIKAFNRSSGLQEGSILESYVFDNKDPREDEMQRQLIPEMVKALREKTGLSQKAFAEKYEVSLSSLEAWEAGRKKMSKYAYTYLKESLLDDIRAVKKIGTLTIPFEVMDEEGIQYVINCSAATKEMGKALYVRELKPRDEMDDTTYIAEVDHSIEIVDGKEVRAIEKYNCPESVKECLRVASKYSCDRIEFSFWGDIGFSMKATTKERLDYYLSGEYLSYEGE